MSDLPVADQPSIFLQDVKYFLRCFFKRESAHKRCISMEIAFIVDGIQDIKTVPDPCLKVFHAVPRSSMDAPGTLIGPDIIGECKRDRSVRVKGVCRSGLLQILPLHCHYGFPELQARNSCNLGDEWFGKNENTFSRRDKNIIQIRVDSNSKACGKSPGRSCPDKNRTF